MQVVVQQGLLKRFTKQQHRTEAVQSHTRMHGTEQVLDFTDATAQLQVAAASSDNQKQSSFSQTQCVSPVTWTTSDPWFTYAAMTITLGVLAFK